MGLATKSITLENQQAHMYMDTLSNYKDKRGILGYAIARNIRILQGSLTEYLSMYNELATKYSVDEKDEAGNKTGRQVISGKAVKQFESDLTPFAKIKHNVTICTMPFEECIDDLSTEDILALDFMLVDPLESSGGTTGAIGYDKVVDTLPDGTEVHEVSVPLNSK